MMPVSARRGLYPSRGGDRAIPDGVCPCRDRAIDNPILNSPYLEPTRHFRFDANNQITSTIDAGRRGSSYFLPIAAPKKKARPGLFDDVEEKKAESGHVNRIRQLVKPWRDRGWPDVTPVTRGLLEHWHAEDRSAALFFCQIEALETLIFITEVAKQTKYGHDWIEKYLREKAEEAGTDLFRVACKMATGSGKTVVMSMLIAWQVLNKRRYPHDNRFTDAFLVVAPGITIRDRLRVLLPSDPNNYYRELDIVPTEYRGDLGTARIVITNFHAFKLRERGDAGGLTKRILTAQHARRVHRIARRDGEPRLQRPGQAPRDHGHQRRGAPLLPRQARPRPKEKMTAEEASEAKARDEEARLWITGLEAVHKKIGVKAVFDLSATPFYLKGSGYPEGTLFPWVVSDFSLMDAIECGIVKIPRVPDRRQRDDRRLPEVPQPVGGHPRRAEGRAPRAGGRPQAAAASGAARRRAEEPVRPLRPEVRRVGGRRGVAGQRQHAARVHRRLQQHQRQQGGLPHSAQVLPPGATLQAPEQPGELAAGGGGIPASDAGLRSCASASGAYDRSGRGTKRLSGKLRRRFCGN